MSENTPRIPLSVVQSDVQEVIAENPIDPQMPLDEQRKVKESRRELIRKKHLDIKAALRVEQLLDVYEREDEAIAIREKQIESADPSKVWTVIAREGRLGQFESLQQLGEGGTSQAWLCKTVYADITLVIKLVGARTTTGSNGGASTSLHREMPDDERRQVLALNEIQSRFGMLHPNVVRVYDVGHMQTPEGVFPYVAMEHVPGDTLLKWWDRTYDEKQATRVAAQIVATVADAVEFCNSKGIFHGDITPTNIMTEWKAGPGPCGRSGKSC